MGDNLFSNLRAGKPSLGVGIMFPSPEVVEIYGKAGWDVFYASMHGSRTDWDDLAHMVRASYRWGITACARIPIQPWVGSYNPHLAVDARRALALGAQVVVASVHDHREVDDLVKTGLYEAERLGYDVMVVPMVECGQAWEDLDNIVAVEGLRSVFLGVGDVARALGADAIEDAVMVEAVKRFVGTLKAKNLHVMVNTGYAPDFRTSFEMTADRAQWLCDSGVDVVFTEPTEVFLQAQTKRLAHSIRGKWGLPEA